MGSSFMSSRKLNKRGSKASNAGFSLVELLIAVVILAIIVIPMLRMFVTSTRINVKSRQMLRATTVAQDIMEGLKAYTLEEVKAQFTPPEGTSGNSYFFPTEGFYVVNTSMIQGGVKEIIELEKEDPDDPDHEIYYFGIKNLKMQGGEYDALIKLDASTYTDAKAGQDDSLHDNVFNGAYYAEVGSVEETSGGSGTDSSYHEHKELNDAVLADAKEHFKGVIGEENLPSDWDDKTLEDFVTKREILVTIEDNGSVDVDGNGECKATIKFAYECEYGDETYTSYGKDGTLAGKVDGTITRIFSSGNFYLFYYPIYKSGVEVDNITFEIKNASKLTDPDAPMLKSLTLAKQIRSEVLVAEGVIVPELTDAKLNEAENSYLATVEITADTALKSVLNFKTNVRTNLANQAKTTDPNTGKVEWGTLNQSKVKVRSGTGVSAADVNIIDMIGDTVSDKVTNVIYDIEISVYETGAADHFGDADFDINREQSRLAKITNLDQ